MKHASLAIALLVLAAPAGATDDSFAVEAAKRVDATIRWLPKSIVKGNFTCQGRQEFAILGTSEKEIVVAVFALGSTSPVDVMRFSGIARSPESASLAVEPLDCTLEEFEREVGAVPDGLVPSKICLGLNMTDQMIDSAHIYWHRKNRRFESWSR